MANCFSNTQSNIEYADVQDFFQYYDGGCIKLGRKVVDADDDGSLISIEYIDADGNPIVDPVFIPAKDQAPLEHFAGCGGGGGGGGAGVADGNDISTLVDNGDGTFTHTANGVAITIDMATALDQIPAATLNTIITNAIAANPDVIITALAAATNLINIDDLAGTTTHKAFPA